MSISKLWRFDYEMCTCLILRILILQQLMWCRFMCFYLLVTKKSVDYTAK